MIFRKTISTKWMKPLFFVYCGMIVGNDAFFETVISLLREGETVTVPVKGDSMLPFIEGGVDSVVLEGIEEGSAPGHPRRKAKAGDIVLFRADGRFIIHRILRIGDDGVAAIQGDGILKADDRCPSDRIFGRVVTVLKGGKRPVDVRSGLYRLKVRIWLALKPFRRILLGLRKLFRKVR